MRFLFKILISGLSVLITAYLLPGVVIDNYLIAILVAIVLAFLNSFIKPLLVLFTIPATIFTFGLFLLIINAFIILLTDYAVDGFHVNGFWWALIFSIVLSVITSIFEKINTKARVNSK